MIKVKPLEWNSHGFAHTDLGVFFHIDVRDDCAILERVQNYSTTKSAHTTEEQAKESAQEWFDWTVNSVLALPAKEPSDGR